MGSIAFFVGIFPGILGALAKSLYKLPEWIQVVILTIPIQTAYMASAVIPARRLCPQTPVSEQLDLKAPPRFFRSFGMTTAAVFLLYPLLTLVTILTGTLLHKFGVKTGPQELIHILGIANLPTSLAVITGALFFAPLGEELVFRHILYKKFERIAPPVGAAAISAFLFALSHYNALIFPSMFLLGLALQLIYIKSKSLSCAVYAHMLYNLISILLLFLMRWNVL